VLVTLVLNTSSASSLSTAYFITLFNVFTWILLFGFWPTESHFEAGNATIIEEDSTQAKPFLRSDNFVAEEEEEGEEKEEKKTPETVA